MVGSVNLPDQTVEKLKKMVQEAVGHIFSQMEPFTCPATITMMADVFALAQANLLLKYIPKEEWPEATESIQEVTIQMACELWAHFEEERIRQLRESAGVVQRGGN